MEIPRIDKASVLDDRTLLVTFKNGKTKRYDISKLLKLEMFEPLANPAFFKNFTVESGGFAVVWNSNIDLSEFEIWQNGIDPS